MALAPHRGTPEPAQTGPPGRRSSPAQPILLPRPAGPVGQASSDLNREVWGCPPSLRGELTKGQTASTLAFVFGAAAVAGLGAGIPLVVVGSRSPAPEGAKAARIELGVVPVAGGAVAAAGGRF